MTDLNIAFIGAGNMATSIIGGMVSKGFSAQSIIASDPNPQSLSQLSRTFAIRTTSDNDEAVTGADVVVLAVKPQVMESVLRALSPAAKASAPLFISIAAGIASSSLDKWLGGNTAIVRCMPNTPALVQTGASALHANPRVSAKQREQANSILEAVGIALWVEQESELHAVTAVSGSGPAYFFLVMEAMQAAGEQLGLSAHTAKQLTLQTALGAAKMAVASDVDVIELRRRVTSPKGTTFEAIEVFEQQGLRETFKQAMQACYARSQSLAKEMDNN